MALFLRARAIKALLVVVACEHIFGRKWMVMAAPEPNELVVLNEAFRRLSEVKTLDEIKAIRDKAEAVRAYAQSAQMGLELQNLAAELKLRAERKAGELLSALKLRGGDRKSKGHRDRLKLVELGISQNQSKRWQQEAAVPDEQFDRYVEHAHRARVEISAAALIRLARQLNRRGKSAPVSAKEARSKQPATATSCSGGLFRRLDSNHLDEASQAIAELKGHCDALAHAVEPLFPTTSDSVPKQNASRLTLRYITEMAQLIARLEELLE